MRHWSLCEVSAVILVALVAAHVLATGAFYVSARIGQIEIVRNQTLILAALDRLIGAR